MVKHIILWKLNDELSTEQKKAVKTDIKKNLEALVGVVPGLTKMNIRTEFLDSSSADGQRIRIKRSSKRLSDTSFTCACC